MNPATQPRQRRSAGRLLVLDPQTGSLTNSSLAQLASWFRRGDLLVFNDAATLPASLMGHADGSEVELRLMARCHDGSWHAVLFGPGDWRTPTERRQPPVHLATGSRLLFGDLEAVVVACNPASRRFVRVRFTCASDDALYDAL